MKYVVDINERSNKGKALKILLENEESVKITTFNKYQEIEDTILAREIRKADKTQLISYVEGKKEFARIKKRLGK